MIQALHIFRKDARRFAYEICVLAVLTCAWAWAHIAPDLRATYANLAGAILTLGWWYLIARLVHEEPLTGDRQFWITRPYSRLSLVAAKTLFIVAFVNVPLLLGGFAILGAAGYRPLAYLPNFLWMQLTFTMIALLVPGALASLTRNLAQFVLTILGLCIGVMALSAIGGPINTGPLYQSRGPAWTADLLPLSIGLASLCMLLLQLRRRDRLISASVGIALVVLVLFADSDLHWRIGTTVQSRMFRQDGTASAAVNISVAGVEPDSKRPDRTGAALAVPLRIRNIPEGETAAPEIVELIFEAPGGLRWSSGWIAAASSEASVFQTDPSPDHTFIWRQRVVMDRRFWRSARSRDVTIRGVVWAMLYDRRSIRLDENGVTPVTGDGKCAASRPVASRWIFNCQAPFHEPFDSFELNHLISFWNSPFPADLGMSPLSTNDVNGGEADPIFLRFDPRAYIQRSIEPATLRLK